MRLPVILRRVVVAAPVTEGFFPVWRLTEDTATATAAGNLWIPRRTDASATPTTAGNFRMAFRTEVDATPMTAIVLV